MRTAYKPVPPAPPDRGNGFAGTDNTARELLNAAEQL